MGPTTIVRCGEPGCDAVAEFKIAAPWSDRERRFWELKTYGFACREHLRDVLRSAESRWLDYEPVPGEIVEDIAIYRYAAGLKDRDLERIADVEEAGDLE